MPLALAVALGALCAAVGALLLLPLPEAGLPLLLIGLRLLARRYAWAARAVERVDRAAAGVRTVFRRLPRPVRVALLVLAVGLVVLGVRHLVRAE